MMKYQKNDFQKKGTYIVSPCENRMQPISKKKYEVDYIGKYSESALENRNQAKKIDSTSDLIVEENTVYEIDRECASCLANKLK